MATVTLEHVSKTFAGGVQAVRDVSLEIGNNEFLVLLGPSGCGKTTLLRIIAGLDAPTSGEIRFEGKVVNFVPPKARDVGMVFQNYALYPHMHVLDNLTLGMRLRGTRKANVRQALDSTATMLGVSHLLKRMPRQLSGGQQQRVAVGRAVIREPSVLLMDEPLSNLDARLRVQLRTELIKLHRRLNTTIVYVTHDQSEAMTMGTRVVVMRDGAIQQQDTPLNVYRNPGNKFVAGFMGSPEMNFLEVESGSTNDEGLLATDRFVVQLPLERVAILERHGHRPFWLGIRPEDVSLRPLDTAQCVIPATVDVVEPLGGSTLVYAIAGEASIVSELPADAEPQVGERVGLYFEPSKIKAFDFASEAALW